MLLFELPETAFRRGCLHAAVVALDHIGVGSRPLSRANIFLTLELVHLADSVHRGRCCHGWVVAREDIGGLLRQAELRASRAGQLELVEQTRVAILKVVQQGYSL